jgi:hypothetical protein
VAAGSSTLTIEGDRDEGVCENEIVWVGQDLA